MALNDKLEDPVYPHVPGERVEAVFLARSGPGFKWAVLAPLIFHLMGEACVIAITDRRIVVFRTSRLNPTMPTAEIASHPHDELTAGSDPNRIVLAGKRYSVDGRSRKEAEDAVRRLANPVG